MATLFVWDGSAFIPAGPAAPTGPVGAASGDLSGSYPGPTVAKLQGRDVVATAPTDGQVLVWNSAFSRWEPQQNPGSSDMIKWSCFTIGTTADAKYLSPGGGYDGLGHATELQFRAARDGRIQNLRVRATGAGVGAATLTYTVRDGGVATAVTFGMSNTAQDGSDLVNFVDVLAGALVSFEVVKSVGITSSPTHIFATAEFV